MDISLNKLIDKLPNIISEASKSPLGIFSRIIISLAILAFLFFRHSSSGIRVSVFILFLGVCLFVIVSIHSTHSPYSESNQAQRPNLMLAMMGANVFSQGAEDVRDRLTGIAIEAKVCNTGAPSVATGWLLFVIPENALPVAAQLTKIPESLRLEGPINSTIIRASESLVAKTKTTPVQTTPVEGRLLFYAPMKRENILAPTTRLELVVRDIYGSETKTTQLMGDWLHR